MALMPPPSFVVNPLLGISSNNQSYLDQSDMAQEPTHHHCQCQSCNYLFLLDRLGSYVMDKSHPLAQPKDGSNLAHGPMGHHGTRNT
eukprot:3069635-Amphidinium_carterae.1